MVTQSDETAEVDGGSLKLKDRILIVWVVFLRFYIDFWVVFLRKKVYLCLVFLRKNKYGLF